MEQILSRFHTDKAPTLWLTPTITITTNKGNNVVSDSMYEIWGWCYWYNFEAYNKWVVYLITTDWGSDDLDDRYQHTTNTLDAYENKYDRGRSWGGGLWVDYSKITRAVWNPNEELLLEWWLGDKLSKLDQDKIIEAVIASKENIDYAKIKDYILASEQSVIEEIEKIPNYSDKIQALGELVTSKLEQIQQEIILQWQATFDGIEEQIKNIEKVDYEKIQSFYKEVDLQPILKYLEWVTDQLSKDNVILGDLIEGTKKEFQDIAIQLSDKIQANKELIQDSNIKTEALEWLVSIGNQIKELKQAETAINEINKKYLLAIYNLVYGIKNK